MVGRIRENVLTESNIRELVMLVDEEMDGIAREQRQRLETAEAELADVKRRLERLYELAETSDLDIEDFKPRIRDHRERQERLQAQRRGPEICFPSVGWCWTTWRRLPPSART